MHLPPHHYDIFFSTVRLMPAEAAGAQALESLGTGFFCRAPLRDGTNRQVVLLISSRQAFVSGPQVVAFSLHRIRPDGSGPVLGQTVTAHLDPSVSMYVEHPDPEVDLSCTSLSHIVDPASGVYSRSISVDALCDLTGPDLEPGAPVWFVGYPDYLYDRAHNLPLLQRGSVASIPSLDFDGQPAFVIEAQVHPGSVGSPVLTTMGGQDRLLGVLEPAVIRQGHLQRATRAELRTQLSSPALGLGLVTKAHLIRELVDLVVDLARGLG